MDMGKRLTQAIIALAFVAATGHGNEILDKGDATDTRIGGDGIKPSVAIDSLGQPHASLVSSGLRDVILYHKIGSRWQGTTWNLANNTGLIGTINNSHIEIEPSTDRAWVSGIMYKAGDVPNTGMAILSRRNVSTSPGAIAFKREWVLRRRGWPLGNVAVDPGIPNRGIVYASGGEWQELIASGDSITSGSGYGIFMDVAGGERTTFAISKAAPVSHPGNNGAPGGSHAVWHAAIGGHQSFWPSYYQNSTMSSKAVWLDPHHYTSQLEEWNYPSVCADSEDGRIGYMAGYELDNHSEGLLINVWNGTRMVRDPKNLIRFDGNMETRRYGPQMAAASGGGVWVTYSRGGWIYLQYVSQDGTAGGEYSICAGTQGAIADDGEGGLHMVYLNGGTRYRKLTVTGTASINYTPPIDFNGDGSHDLGIYDTATGNWWGKDATADGRGRVLVRGRNWGGWATSVPVPGNYSGTATSAYELAVHDTRDGNWFINDGGSLPSAQWGGNGQVPMPADYTGDGITDLGTYDPNTGNWHVKTLSGTVVVNGDNWGWQGTQPIAADFNGDGACDLAVYDPLTYRWFIREAISRTIIASEVWWGYQGTIPVALNIDADPEFELGAYDPNGGRWHIADVPGTTSSNVIPDYASWGFRGALPAPANYDGDTNNIWEVGVYDPSKANWYIRGVNNTTPDNWGWPGATAVPLGAVR